MILLYVVNTPEFFLSHRLPLALAARDAGFCVHVATGGGAAASRISELGFTHHQFPLSRSGRNPFLELGSLWALYRLMKAVTPDLVHLVTIKPVLYGGVAARLAGVRSIVAAISGLGTVFVARENGCSWLPFIVKRLYRLALAHRKIRVIFQNMDDLSLLVNSGAVAFENAVLVEGSGVDLADYPVCPEPEGVPVVTFAARLLKDKGVMEFAQAAQILQARGCNARFLLAGLPDTGNLTSATEEDVAQWRQQGLLEPLGHTSDIVGLFAKSNIVVLPSYREGLPKVLIEAAACARAVVTTDVPGCRSAITPGVTGVLVPVRDASALADAVQALIDNPVRRREMGAAGRVLAENKYAIEKVVNAHMAVYRELRESKSGW